MGLVPGLAQALLVQENHGVRRNDNVLRPAEPGGGLRLLPGDVGDYLLGGQPLGEVFLHLRHPDHKVRHADALQKLPPPGRAGGQYNLCHI